jgi:predicted small integral membrane protein
MENSMMKNTITSQRWNQIYITIIAVMALILAALVWAVPVVDGAKDWTGQLVRGGWMAWTFPVALFFFIIASLLITFTLLAIRFPEVPRVGILRIETTRGDRLFISLLGSAFINLGWLFFFGAPLFGALIICVFYAAAVFRWV